MADLRRATGRFPHDARLATLVRTLTAGSPRFAELWESGTVGRHDATTKVVDHPHVGTVTLDCDLLSVHGSDLRIIVYSATPGSPDADALALIGVLGLQRFTTRA